jgi:hypothetical protein
MLDDSSSDLPVRSGNDVIDRPAGGSSGSIEQRSQFRKQGIISRIRQLRRQFSLHREAL